MNLTTAISQLARIIRSSKKIILIAIVLFAGVTLYSQEEEASLIKNKKDKEIITIFGHVDSHGGFWALNMNYSEIDKQQAMFIGCRGSWVIGHGFAFGFGGGGFFNNNSYNELLEENVNIGGGYGGITLEGIVLPKLPVHISIPVFLGVGGISYTSDVYNNENEDWYYSVQAGDAFLIAEPGIEIEINLVKAVRIGLGVSYRFTSDLDMDYEATGVPNDVLNGLTIGASLKLGKF